MSTALLIIIAAVAIGLLVVLLALLFRQRLAKLLFSAPVIGPRIRARAAAEMVANPEQILEQQGLSSQQRQTLKQTLAGREPEEIEQLMNKALSGQTLTAKDLQRPVGSGKMSKKQVAARRRKKRQARQARKKGRK